MIEMETQLGSEALEYLGTKKSKNTFKVYRASLNYFLDYYRGKHGEEASLSDFLDRLDENAKLPRREKKRLAEIELNDFIDFLKNQEKGKSNNTIRAYFSGIQNFLRYKGFDVSARFVRLPSSIPKKVNHKHRWKIEHIREFVNSANSMRDKAIILCLLQSGLSVNDLCNLDYGDVKGELEEGRLPLHLHLFRQKTKEEFRTFFGRDAVKYLKLYLETRKDLRHESSLFNMAGSTKRITEGAIQGRFREIAKDLSFIRDREMKGYNPCRPHSLRSAFNSRLIGKANPDLIEFFMGHSLGTTKMAYLNLPVDELRELYANSCEPHLTIEKTSKDELVEVREIPKETLERMKKEITEEIWRRTKAFFEEKVEQGKGEIHDSKDIEGVDVGKVFTREVSEDEMKMLRRRYFKKMKEESSEKVE